MSGYNYGLWASRSHKSWLKLSSEFSQAKCQGIHFHLRVLTANENVNAIHVNRILNLENIPLPMMPLAYPVNFLYPELKIKWASQNRTIGEECCSTTFYVTRRLSVLKRADFFFVKDAREDEGNTFHFFLEDGHFDYHYQGKGRGQRSNLIECMAFWYL